VVCWKYRTPLISILINFAHHRPETAGLINPANGLGKHDGVFLRYLIVQNHIEQRFMNLDATVVFNKAKFAEAISLS
jgi:hypothetical protein